MIPATLCYCSSREGADCRPLAVCADCQAFLIEHSPRIEATWRVLLKWWGNGYNVEGLAYVDRAEEFHRLIYLSAR